MLFPVIAVHCPMHLVSWSYDGFCGYGAEPRWLWLLFFQDAVIFWLKFKEPLLLLEYIFPPVVVLISLQTLFSFSVFFLHSLLLFFLAIVVCLEGIALFNSNEYVFNYLVLVLLTHIQYVVFNIYSMFSFCSSWKAWFLQDGWVIAALQVQVHCNLQHT